jgi:hypothetical protein
MITLVTMLVLAAPVMAQQTTGTITGRITDAQQAGVPGVMVTATNTATGFTRSDVTTTEGLYRIAALPVGTYDIKAELQGFKTNSRKGVAIDVATAIDVPLTLEVGSLTETVSVTAEAPMVNRTESAVGGVVDVARMENMPLNGRQFANAAITIPGVALGFHSDPTKSSQYSPQIAGGNGRNVNYQIDGGDNNDDTVGGLLQLFPLEAIEQFNFVTQRYKAEHGRSNGGVMNIVTKSGTNTLAGSWFTMFRDKSLNAVTETQKISAKAAGTDPVKPDYRRWQYGGSVGGPIVQNRMHYFGAFERTQQDTFQTVDTRGLFPDLDGVYATPYKENLLTAKVTANINAAQYLAVRYGLNTNSQPYGVSPQSPPSGWGESANEFNSINVNHNWVLGGSKLNEFIFQYADFSNSITANSLDPRITFSNNVAIGQNPNTPQQTQQKKYQFRDDFSWSMSGMGGLGHDFKAGVNFINEPRLFITFNTGTGDYAYSLITTDINGPVSSVSLNGGAAEANIPVWQLGLYIQDDWRITDRLTANLGFRYDYLDGYAIDQSKNPNWVKLQNAGAAGRFAGQPFFREFGLEPQEDKNNWQPRVGLAYDMNGNGHDVLRAGYGRYYDVGYTNANVLFPAINATGIGAGQIFALTRTTGILKADGTFFHVGDPISTIASQNEINLAAGLPLNSNNASPRIRQPYTDQFSFGWSHQLNDVTVFDVDYVESHGNDLGWRLQLNQRNPGVGATGARQFADLGLNIANFTVNTSEGESRYRGINFGVRRRMSRGLSYSAWYTLSKAIGNTGNGVDELNVQNIQNHLDPYADVQMGPAGRTDARHKATISLVWQGPWGITVSPVFRYRSALPVNLVDGRDFNANGVANDIPGTAYAYDGLDDAGNPIVKEIGVCETVNCGRGAAESALNLRVSKGFSLWGRTRVEAIGEIFNVLNAKNPSGFTARVTIPSTGAPDPNLLRPSSYSGDFQRPEQRVGQVGFRFTF